MSPPDSAQDERISTTWVQAASRHSQGPRIGYPSAIQPMIGEGAVQGCPARSPFSALGKKQDGLSEW